MAVDRELRYWQKMKYQGMNDLLKKENQGKPCWEVARELGDFRSAFNVCKDCIAFVLKNDTTLLSEEEVHSLENRKVFCSFFNA